jgi:transcriptional regulator with XRE-family HTH domain
MVVRRKQRKAKRAGRRASTAPRALSTSTRSRVSTVDTITATFDTEGSRLMTELPGSLRELAGQVGCSAQTIANWRSGSKVPDSHYRALIHTAWGIPPEAWSVSPHTALANDGSQQQAATNGHATVDDALPSTLDRCLEQLAALRRDSLKPGLLPGDRARIAGIEAKWLAMRISLERAQELLEARIVLEHPRWRMLERAVAKALAPYPDAAKAVAAVLSEFDSPTSPNADVQPVGSAAGQRSAVHA